MTDTSRKRALDNYRRRLGDRGMARFEVLGLDRDRELIRSVARRLAANDASAEKLRQELAKDSARERPRGNILAALRRSPLVGVELDLTREETSGRPADL